MPTNANPCQTPLYHLCAPCFRTSDPGTGGGFLWWGTDRLFISDNGRNLLHFAAKDDLKEVAEYLVGRSLVNMYQKDMNGETPLDYAIRFKNPEIAEIIKNKK